MLDHQGHQANIMGSLAERTVLGDQSFPDGIDLCGLGKNLKDGAGGGDFRGRLLGGHAEAVAAGWSSADDVHLVKALGRDGKMLPVAQSEPFQSIKGDLAMWMSDLGNA